MFAEVILSKVSRNIDKIYHYKIPEGLEGKAQTGSQVLVPFGRRSEIGYIVGLLEKTTIKGIKEIVKVTSEYPLFTKKQVDLAKWLADYYYSFLITALRMVMPPGTAGQEGKRQKAGGRRQEEKEPSSLYQIQTPLLPTDEQKKALDMINSAVNANQPEKILLYGITGSGKTEVYLQAIEHVLKQGKSAIVLVPEIALTPQLIQRFEGRFQDSIATLHSHMTLKERSGEWQRVSSGEARIVLGARSAVFAPVKNLGMVVIDEEYETSYKQDKNPRYHVREVAFQLAEMHKAIVVLGSATPSLETYFRAEEGEYKKAVLSQRIDSRPLPPVEIINMCRGKDYLLSQRLREELKSTLERKEQAILFINRRGYFTFVMCRECGFAIECPRCSIALTYHSADKRIRCNRCGYNGSVPGSCPQCNSGSIGYFGIGTQRIENEVAQVFPAARILRYDSDAVSKRGSHEVFFSAFAEGRADVLVGTQMVAKGLDVANVTLVGVIAADTALHLPDFRSAEHTFQLLTQVAGRAGRHHLPGKVIIQTYNPEHYAIQAAAKHDYEEFYKQEISHRREVGYPPFSKLISLLIAGPEAKKVEKVAEDLERFLRKRLSEGILGPAPAIIPKLRGEWRYRILLKGEDLDKMRGAVVETLGKIVIPSEIKVAVDVEPMNML
jgi:primosomal protein N' (replication factor Y)